MQRKGETCQLRSIGGHVNAGFAGGRTPADDSAVGFRRAVAVTVGFGRYGCVTREFLLYSRGRAILGHPTPVRMRKCVPANSHQAEFSSYGSEVVLLDGTGMIAAASDV